MANSRDFAVVLEPDSEGQGFTVLVPALPGVVTEGDTLEEALTNARDAIQLCLDDLIEQGLEIPPSDVGARLERIEISLAS
jgi:antitoxin HicB